MTRILAVFAVLLGLLQAPMGLSHGTSWLIPAAHLLLCVLVTPLALQSGLDGRPTEARAWAAWVVVATGGGMVAIHVSNWDAGGWSWAFPYASALLWGWVPVVVGLMAASVGEGTRWRRSRRAVRRRHAAANAMDAIEAAVRADQNRVG